MNAKLNPLPEVKKPITHKLAPIEMPKVTSQGFDLINPSNNNLDFSDNKLNSYTDTHQQHHNIKFEDE